MLVPTGISTNEKKKKKKKKEIASSFLRVAAPSLGAVPVATRDACEICWGVGAGAAAWRAPA